MVSVKSIEEIKEFSAKDFVRKRIFETEALHFNIYCILPGQKNPLHKHPISDEVLYFVAGKGETVVGKEKVTVSTGSIVLVPKDMAHEIVNTGDSEMIVVLAQAPLPVSHVAVER